MIQTVFSKNIRRDAVLKEYPRPQMVRNSYLNLNGQWDYAVTKLTEQPTSFTGKILVPFSPETQISGVQHQLKPDELLWYRKRLTLPDGFFTPGSDKRLLLHFTAVDQIATVFVDKREAGHHAGGFTPFTVDITDYVQSEHFTIQVKVRDYTDTSFHSRGKQKQKHSGIFYTPQSGIWQTVWMEAVPRTYIKSLLITPEFDSREICIRAKTSTPCVCELKFQDRTVRFSSGTTARIRVKNMHPWSPEDPYLYPFSVSAGEDSVESYFAMRKYSMEEVNGRKVFCLNNKPYFLNGVLDQGYWSDGLLTAPSDEALLYDIRSMKELGFNLMRKHIKLEPLRYYYHCDTLGMLVMQDMPNGGGKYRAGIVTAPLFTKRHKKDDGYKAFAREDPAGRVEYETELTELIETVYNSPCVCSYVPFNEGWGQFDALRITEKIKQLDSTRPVDHASGWHDQGGGDFKSMHVYFKPFKAESDSIGRALLLSEFGGILYKIPEHTDAKKVFGYKVAVSDETYFSKLSELYEKEILPAIREGLAGCIYTQVSDVEEELNGFLTYDRKVCKVNPEKARELFSKLQTVFNKTISESETAEEELPQDIDKQKQS